MSSGNFMLGLVEHEKNFITSGARGEIFYPSQLPAAWPTDVI